MVGDTKLHFECIAHSFTGVRDLADVANGLLRVTAAVALARQQLLTRLDEFLRANPEVQLILDLSDRINLLSTDGFDVPIRHTVFGPRHSCGVAYM